MARTGSDDTAQQKAMLDKRIGGRDDPFPVERPGCAGRSRLPAGQPVAPGDRPLPRGLPRRHHGGRHRSGASLNGGGLRRCAGTRWRAAVGRGIAEIDASYLGVRPPSGDARWFQLVLPGQIAPSADAAGLIYALGHRFGPGGGDKCRRGPGSGAFGLVADGPGRGDPLRARRGLRTCCCWTGSAGLGTPWAELRGAPDLTILARCRDDPAPARSRGGDRPRLLRRRTLRHRRGQGDCARRRRRGAGGGRWPSRRRPPSRAPASSRSRPTAATRTARRAPPTSSRRPLQRPR